MNTLYLSTLSSIFLILSCSCAASSHDEHQDFLGCLSQQSHNFSSISNLVYTTTNSSYTSILKHLIWNLLFATESTPKPQVIITPHHESQIPPVIYCAKQHGLEIRTRGGGHDYEGLSYVSQSPFVMIDMINLRDITVDVEKKTAWIGAGATLGEVYYRVAEKSPILGFPAGICKTVGVGGHFSGGGYGTLLRKYGMSADNVIDARMIDVNGRILDRKSMGEDLFWAIRGGGGASFGVIVAWHVRLVDVPETVTVFQINKTVKQNLTQLVHRWQYVAPKIHQDLYIGVLMYRVNTNIYASFYSLFLGGTNKLLALMQECFPELGLVREDCVEMSWVESTVTFDVLSNGNMTDRKRMKAKSDFVQTPMPELGLEGLVRMLSEPEATDTVVSFVPYDGRMDEISDSDTPFPHRTGNLYMLSDLIFWDDDDGSNSDRYISWVRRYYSYMTPYVSKNPRAAYLNYRDLDIGVNNIDGKPSYEQSSVWGKKYFNNNFDRLVRVKAVVDPDNFFKNEQSIPPLHSS